MISLFCIGTERWLDRKGQQKAGAQPSPAAKSVDVHASLTDLISRARTNDRTIPLSVFAGEGK